MLYYINVDEVNLGDISQEEDSQLYEIFKGEGIILKEDNISAIESKTKEINDNFSIIKKDLKTFVKENDFSDYVDIRGMVIHKSDCSDYLFKNYTKQIEDRILNAKDQFLEIDSILLEYVPYVLDVIINDIKAHMENNSKEIQWR